MTFGSVSLKTALVKAKNNLQVELWINCYYLITIDNIVEDVQFIPQGLRQFVGALLLSSTLRDVIKLRKMPNAMIKIPLETIS